MTATRAAFDDVLAGRTGGRPAWLPLVDELAARVQATTYRELTGDPGLWSAGLVQAAELLGADAIVAGFDLTLAAEACGAELDWAAAVPVVRARPQAIAQQPLAAPRLAAMLETVRRLRATAHERRGLVAALAGPASLAQQLCPEVPLEEGLRRIKAVHTIIVEAALGARPDLLLFLERLPEPSLRQPWQRAFGTLRNLAVHYDVPLAAYAIGWTPDAVAGLASLRLPVYLLGPGAGNALAVARSLAADRAAAGIPVPVNTIGAVRELMTEAAAARAAGRNVFLTTAAAVGSRGDLADLRGLAAELLGRAA